MRYRTAFDDLFEMFNDFDEMFRRTFQDLDTGVKRLPSGAAAMAPAAGRAPITGATWVPAVESFIKDGLYHLRFELPGVDPKEVSVSVTGDQLLVTGEKKTSREIDEKSVYFSESRYGRFQRSFRLPEGVRSEDVKAAYENGVLQLTIPVPAEVQPKTVRIEVASDPKKIKAA